MGSHEQISNMTEKQKHVMHRLGKAVVTLRKRHLATAATTADTKGRLATPTTQAWPRGKPKPVTLVHISNVPTVKLCRTAEKTIHQLIQMCQLPNLSNGWQS